MNKKLIAVALLGAALVAGPVAAADYNYVQGSYTAQDIQNRASDV